MNDARKKKEIKQFERTKKGKKWDWKQRKNQEREQAN